MCYRCWRNRKAVVADDKFPEIENKKLPIPVPKKKGFRWEAPATVFLRIFKYS